MHYHLLRVVVTADADSFVKSVVAVVVVTSISIVGSCVNDGHELMLLY